MVDRPIDRLRHKLRIRNDLMRSALAEFIGSVLFTWAGTSVLAQTHLSRGRSNEYVSIAFGWGIALILATQTAFRISGGHLNPAVSIFLFTFRQISIVQFLIYALAQTCGAFVGALCTFTIYYDSINSFDGGERYVTGPLQTAKIFATFPADHLSIFGGFIDQVLGTIFLCFCVGMITDHRNRIPSHLQPTFIGISLTLIAIAFGFNAGFAVNPARDFGPRLFSFFAGYGLKVFSYRTFKWFWVPIIAPLIGGVLGAWLYYATIGFHIPSEIDDLEEKVRQIQLDKAANQQGTNGTDQNDNNSYYNNNFFDNNK